MAGLAAPSGAVLLASTVVALSALFFYLRALERSGQSPCEPSAEQKRQLKQAKAKRLKAKAKAASTKQASSGGNAAGGEPEPTPVRILFGTQTGASKGENATACT